MKKSFTTLGPDLNHRWAHMSEITISDLSAQSVFVFCRRQTGLSNGLRLLLIRWQHTNYDLHVLEILYSFIKRKVKIVLLLCSKESILAVQYLHIRQFISKYESLCVLTSAHSKESDQQVHSLLI